MVNQILKKIREINIRLHQRFTPFATRYPGFLCHVVDKSSFLFMYDEIFNKEIYAFEPNTQEPYIIDCGANIGLATIYLKKKFPNAEVVAFEPDPAIYSVLRSNIESAGVADGVTLHQKCLAAQEGSVMFYPDGADGGSNIKNGEEQKKGVEVPAVTLGKYLNKKVDFLKIDIEGVEIEVLEQVQDKLSLVERIFVEYHSFANEQQKLQKLLSILTTAGFRYYIEHIGVTSSRPFVARDIHYGMDLQLNIYGYRD